MTADLLLWRSHYAGVEFLAALDRALDEGRVGADTSLAELMRVVSFDPLRAAVEAMQARERRDAEATGAAYEIQWPI